MKQARLIRARKSDQSGARDLFRFQRSRYAPSILSGVMLIREFGS